MNNKLSVLIIAGLILPFCSVAQASLSDGLIGYWRLDEGSGTVAADSVGSHNGTLQNFSYSGWTSGKIGGGLSFDGANDYVSTALMPPTGSSPRTIAYWAKTTISGRTYIVGASYGGGEGDYGGSFRTGLGYTEYGCEGVNINVSGGVISYSARVGDGVWHFYAWVVPAGAALRDVKVYMDGIQLTQIACTDGYGQVVNTLPVTPFEIGRYPNYRNLWWFYGVLDEVRVYNRALSDSEIAALYRQGQPPVVSTSLATGVTKTSATLNGSITDDGGQACQYRFRYTEEKPDYIYTSWSVVTEPDQSFSQPITGLKPNATYYFNAQALNSAGESDWGNEQSFVASSRWAPLLRIREARMVSPNKLGIDIEVSFPKDAPEESPRKVDFWANVNGMDVFDSCDISSLVGPGETAYIRFDAEPPPPADTVPHRIVNFASKGVPRFEENVSFTLYGQAYWEGGRYSDVNSIPVEIPLPVIIIHGYTYTHEPGILGVDWMDLAKDLVYDDLIRFLAKNGYTTDPNWYRTMWGPTDCHYQADKWTVLDMYAAVHSWVRRSLDSTYANKVNLIGHSTGGLVARYYSGYASTVNKVICIGTPHLGLSTFYQFIFDKSTKEAADRVLRVDRKNPDSEKNLLLWFEPEYLAENFLPKSSLLDATDKVTEVPEPYESNFVVADNSDVDYYSIYANSDLSTPFQLLVDERKKEDGWYEVIGQPIGAPGDGRVPEESARAFPGGPRSILIPAESLRKRKGVHAFLCEEPAVIEELLSLLSGYKLNNDNCL